MKKIIVFSMFCVLMLVVTLPNNLLGKDLTLNEDSPNLVDLNSRTNQIIIKFNENTANKIPAITMDQQISLLSNAVGEELTYARAMSGDAHVLKLSDWMSVAEVEKLASNLSELPSVAYAEPDNIHKIVTNPNEKILVPNVTPNDSRWNDMWHLHYTANSSEGINVAQAWDIAIGLSTTVVAVIDTGILNHSDLAGRTVSGYDFIGDLDVANDGNGRDSDPSDPGDWVATNECGSNNAENSSWHGTHVAGTIAANTNNNAGIAGINWQAKILPVRVLGKCGGYTSDIVDGMRWSAGLAVAGVPANANPADVLNLSLGGFGLCSTTYQDAIDQIVATGATIVIAAGNENMDAMLASPSNCSNVITVAATDRNGDRAFYSNYGSVVEISAPGGETNSVGANGVLSTLDSGTTTPNNDNVYAFYQGTSMATPHVAGVVSLIKSVRPNFTQGEVLALLQGTARGFPAGSGCNTSNCGRGIIDAYQALNFLNISFTDHIYLPVVLADDVPIACSPQGGDSNNINNALTTCSGHTASGQVSGGDLYDVYRIPIKAEKELLLEMNGSGGDADLYLFAPTATDIFSSPIVARSTSDGNNEDINVQIPVEGYWYILVYSYSGTTNYNLTATVTD